ncbi:hypothetical protein [Pseudomonas phage GP100]|nr:hypothetical protein [Pseudomonas phage GP100]
MKTIKIVPYRALLHITENFGEWSKTYTKLSGFSYPQEGTGGLTYDNQDGNYYVWIGDGTINSLVHELSHVSLMVAARCQLEDIVKNQEPFCYLLGHLAQESMKVLPSFKGAK